MKWTTFTCRYKWMRCAKQSEYGKREAPCFMQSDSDCNVISLPTINNCHLALNLKGRCFSQWGLLTIMGQIPLQSDITSTQRQVWRKNWKLENDSYSIRQWDEKMESHVQMIRSDSFVVSLPQVEELPLSRTFKMSRLCWSLFNKNIWMNMWWYSGEKDFHFFIGSHQTRCTSSRLLSIIYIMWLCVKRTGCACVHLRAVCQDYWLP